MSEQEHGSPELGQMVRQAREARGWTVDMLSVALGFFGATRTPYVLGRTQLTRLEQGGRKVTAEEAWRLVEVFHELDALTLLRAADAIDEDASPEFRATIETEAVRRRDAYRQAGGNRRRSDRGPLRPVPTAPAAAVSRPGSVRTGDCTELRRAA
jgi:transcriptional regulator with XRE-family HTH domain